MEKLLSEIEILIEVFKKISKSSEKIIRKVNELVEKIFDIKAQRDKE